MHEFVGLSAADCAATSESLSIVPISAGDIAVYEAVSLRRESTPRDASLKIDTPARYTTVNTAIDSPKSYASVSSIFRAKSLAGIHPFYRSSTGIKLGIFSPAPVAFIARYSVILAKFAFNFSSFHPSCPQLRHQNASCLCFYSDE